MLCLTFLGCKCGEQNNCVVESKKCNCDANDQVWRFDEGYVREEAHLPITEIRLGDTGGPNEMGKHTIGKLQCTEW